MHEMRDDVRLDWELHALQKQCLLRQLTRHGIHFGQPPLLHTIKRFGVCSQSDLARTLRVSPASIAVSLKRMEKSGFIEKLHDPDDQRANRITLTAAGIEAAEQSARALDAMTEQKLAGFTPEEHDQLICLLRRACENLSNFKKQLETE